MDRNRRTYYAECKQNAVQPAKESGKPIAEIAEELGVGADLVYRWRRELNSAGTFSFPGHGKQGLTEEQRRIKELEKELRYVEQERDILKKHWPSSARPEMKFSAIRDACLQYSVKKMCRVLQVSRSGYSDGTYAAHHRAALRRHTLGIASSSSTRNTVELSAARC